MSPSVRKIVDRMFIFRYSALLLAAILVLDDTTLVQSLPVETTFNTVTTVAMTTGTSTAPLKSKSAISALPAPETLPKKSMSAPERGFGVTSTTIVPHTPLPSISSTSQTPPTSVRQTQGPSTPLLPPNSSMSPGTPKSVPNTPEPSTTPREPRSTSTTRTTTTKSTTTTLANKVAVENSGAVVHYYPDVEIPHGCRDGVRPGGMSVYHRTDRYWFAMEDGGID